MLGVGPRQAPSRGHREGEARWEPPRWLCGQLLLDQCHGVGVEDHLSVPDRATASDLIADGSHVLELVERSTADSDFTEVSRPQRERLQSIEQLLLVLVVEFVGVHRCFPSVGRKNVYYLLYHYSYAKSIEYLALLHDEC